MSTGLRRAARIGSRRGGGNVKETFVAAHLRPAGTCFTWRTWSSPCSTAWNGDIQVGGAAVPVVDAKCQNTPNNCHQPEATGSTRACCLSAAGCCVDGAASVQPLLSRREARVTLTGGGPDRCYWEEKQTDFITASARLEVAVKPVTRCIHLKKKLLFLTF